MRVFKFFIILLVSFCTLVSVFNKSLVAYLEQKYHQDYKIDFVVFDYINELSARLHSSGLTLTLFAPQGHSDFLQDLRDKKEDYLIDFGSMKTSFMHNKEEFSIYKLLAKYNQNNPAPNNAINPATNEISLDKREQLSNKREYMTSAQNNTTNHAQNNTINNATSEILPNKREYSPSKSSAKSPNKTTLKSGQSALLIGDSLMQGTGTYIIKELKARGIKAKNIAKQSTGLAYKKFYNWESELGKALDDEHYDAVVVLLGVNDYWDMINPYNKLEYLKFGSPQWEEIYSMRIEQILSVANKKGAKILWYQLPAVKKPSLNTKVATLNQVIQKTIAKHEQTFIKVDDSFGKFESYVADHSGKKRFARGSDGIHFTPFGYSLMAKKLLNHVEFE